MPNVHLYAWLQVESIARGFENLITIFLFTPRELQWPEGSSDTNIILVTAGSFHLFPWRRGSTESAGFEVCPNVYLDLFVFDSMLSTITQLTGI